MRTQGNQTIRVRLPRKAYPVHITSHERDLAAPMAHFLAEGRPAVVVTSRNVARFCLPLLEKILKHHEISYQVVFLPDGERHKNSETVIKAYREFVRLKIDRSFRVLLLGGGVLGDMGGFVASTYLRGLPFIHVPTTLVAQVDSSIGGKLGVDLPEGKNLVGVFEQPVAVFAHVPFLKTLPLREIAGGLGEVIKYGVIADPALFDLVQDKRTEILEDRDENLLFEIVARSVRIKARIVEKDERETSGLRMILNFGHTFGHAIERLTGYRSFLHGEAVGMGMVIAGRLSNRLGFCREDDSLKLRTAVAGVGLPVEAPRFSKKDWLEAIGVDKKARGGMIHFVFMEKLGRVRVKPVRARELVDLL